MKKLIALMAVLFLMTSAIPRERISTLVALNPAKRVIEPKTVYDSLAISVIELKTVLNQ